MEDCKRAQMCTNVQECAHITSLCGGREDSKEDAMLMSITHDLLRYFLPCARALRALGLLLADGALTVGRGKIF